MAGTLVAQPVFAPPPTSERSRRGCMLAAFATLIPTVIVCGLMTGYLLARGGDDAAPPSTDGSTRSATAETPAERSAVTPPVAPVDPMAPLSPRPVAVPQPSTPAPAPALAEPELTDPTVTAPAGWSWPDGETRDWSGSWTAPDQRFGLQLHLTRRAGNVAGRIRWTNLQTRRSGNEYVRGTYDARTGALTFSGHRVTPNAGIGTDSYRLRVGSDGTVSGQSRNHGGWDGRLRARPR